MTEQTKKPEHEVEYIEREDGTEAVVITFDPETLGNDAYELGEWFDSVFWAFEQLRAGAFDGQGRGVLTDIETALGLVQRQLAPRLAGLLDALVRAHYAAGGSHGQLAAAAGWSRSTAQSRAERLPAEPSTFETWARTGLFPEDIAAQETEAGA